jgi:chemotaxis protein MotB
MGFTRKQQPPEEEPGAPEWMLTFSDCMTLLLTFFVLLITFSAPGSGPVISQTSAVFRRIMPGFGRSDGRYRDALLNVLGVEPAAYVAGGSATPTSETTGWGNLTQDFSVRDFSSRRVFLIPSKNIFWGKGTFVSLQGRGILQTMVDLLKRLPNRVIISEGGDGGPKDGDRLGLQRAWVVLEYLAARQHLGRDRFSLSVTGTVHRENAQAGVQAENGADGPPPRLASGDAGAGQRMVEIVLLERSLYN